jgi:hypothetical protein
VEAEIAAKKAYLHRIRMQEQAAREQELANRSMYKIKKQSHEDFEETKKDILRDKFDEWFDALFKKLYKETFGQYDPKVLTFYYFALLFYFMVICNSQQATTH